MKYPVTVSYTHLDVYKRQPEYTAIELYKAYTDYEGMMKLCEDMLSTVAEEVCGSTKVDYQGESLDFRPPWKRMTMTEAVREYALSLIHIWTH